MVNNEPSVPFGNGTPNPENKELSQNSQYNFGIKLGFRKLLFSVKPVLPHEGLSSSGIGGYHE